MDLTDNAFNILCIFLYFLNSMFLCHVYFSFVWWKIYFRPKTKVTPDNRPRLVQYGGVYMKMTRAEYHKLPSSTSDADSE